MYRQTDMSLKELEEHLGSERSSYQASLLANEIGFIATQDTSESEAAQLLLIDMMDSLDLNVRFPAYAYAMRVLDPIEGLSEAMINFVHNPENEEIMRRIGEMSTA